MNDLVSIPDSGFVFKGWTAFSSLYLFPVCIRNISRYFEWAPGGSAFGADNLVMLCLESFIISDILRPIGRFGLQCWELLLVSRLVIL